MDSVVTFFKNSSSLKEKVAMKAGYRDRPFARWRMSLMSCTGSVYRIKLLILLFLVLGSFLFINRASVIMGWSHDLKTARSATPRAGFTVLINTWKRYDLLKRSVSHYSACPGVDAIRVVWSESEVPSESLRSSVEDLVRKGSRKTDRHVSFQFDIHVNDDLNNRFKPLDGLGTDAVLSIDDDVLVPCSSLETAFDVWTSAPDSMVGFVPRMHWIKPKFGGNQFSGSMAHALVFWGSAANLLLNFEPANLNSILPLIPWQWPTVTYNLMRDSRGNDQWSYGGWWSVWWTGTYSMVLSKAAFIHNKYLEIYTNDIPASLRKYVKDRRNCEDIAMSFLVANETGAPPIWVKTAVYEIGSTGISSLQGHSEHRTDCINYFVSLFGSMPLVATHVKVADARRLWFW